MNLFLADFHLFREFLKIEVSLPPLSASLSLSLSPSLSLPLTWMKNAAREWRNTRSKTELFPPPPHFSGCLVNPRPAPTHFYIMSDKPGSLE